MRYWVYDEDNVLIRKFDYKEQAESFLQKCWRIVVQPKPVLPTPETHGEARW